MTRLSDTDTTTTTGRRGGQLPAWLVVAASEFRLLARNRTVLLTATATPLAFGALLAVMTDRGFTAGVTATVATQLILLLAFTVYVAATMTLASRRQSLYLKRLRSSAASVAAIVAGLVAPLVGLLWGQAALVLAATAIVVDEVPTRPALLVVATLLGCLMCAGLAFLTAAFTRTPESAQFTTFPVFIALVGGLIWVNMTPVDEVTVPMLAVPGAAIAQLTRLGWGEPLPEGVGLLAAAGPPAVATVVLAVAACALAGRWFRWDPRA